MPAGFLGRLHLALMVLLAAVATGCVDHTDATLADRLTRDAARSVEMDPAPHGSLPELRGDNFSPVAADIAYFFQVKRQAPACFAAVKTFVRSQQGNNCIPGNANQAIAEIAGWSERCVTNCDTPARLREVNASAAGTCSAYCAQLGCGAQYSAQRQCGSTGCYVGDPNCNAQWPKMDYCMLLQGARVWNCECLPRVTP